MAAALLACAALAAAARARSPDAASGPPLDVSAPVSAATFGDGTLHPWAPPPLPPLPAAELWGDYHQPPIGHRLYKARGPACSRHERFPVLLFVGDVVDGFLALLTYPARKAHAHSCHAGHCDSAATWHNNPALRDCGCYPLPPQPAIIQEQPLALPLPPPESSGTGLSPQPLVEPAPIRPIEPALPVPTQPEPQRLYPGRAPVVELAPELTIPLEPDPLPPRNTIPPPGLRVPRNAIPRP